MEALLWTTAIVVAIALGMSYPGWRLKRALAQPFPSGWLAILERNIPIYSRMQPELQAQLLQLDGQALSLYRSDVTRSADTVDSLLQRLGVSDAEAAQFIRQDPVAGTLLRCTLNSGASSAKSSHEAARLSSRAFLASWV